MQFDYLCLMTNLRVGQTVYRNRDMSQAAFDAGLNMAGKVRAVSGIFVEVVWSDITKTDEFAKDLYVPTA